MVKQTGVLTSCPVVVHMYQTQKFHCICLKTRDVPTDKRRRSIVYIVVNITSNSKRITSCKQKIMGTGSTTSDQSRVQLQRQRAIADTLFSVEPVVYAPSSSHALQSFNSPITRVIISKSKVKLIVIIDKLKCEQNNQHVHGTMLRYVYNTFKTRKINTQLIPTSTRF